MTEPVEALENAVAHHKDEMAPALVARHVTSTWLRRVTTVALGVGVIAVGLEVGMWFSGPDIEGVLATAATVVTWVVGMSLLARMTYAARRMIASSTLRAFERTQGVNALGAAGTSTGVSAFLTPAQKILQQQARAELEQAELKRARREAKARAKGVHGDNEARDFDDA